MGSPVGNGLADYVHREIYVRYPADATDAGIIRLRRAVRRCLALANEEPWLDLDVAFTAAAYRGLQDGARTVRSDASLRGFLSDAQIEAAAEAVAEQDCRDGPRSDYGKILAAAFRETAMRPSNEKRKK